MDDLRRARLLALAAGNQLTIERTEDGVMVGGFLGEWHAFADAAQNNMPQVIDLLKLHPITSNVTRAGFRLTDGALWSDFEKGKLIFDNRGASWYLFLSPGASDAEIGSLAVEARMRIIQSLMNAENANDIPNVGG